MLNAQEINKIVYDDVAKENILYGYCNTEGFSGDDFNYWFQDEFNHYVVDTKTLDLLNSDLINAMQVKVVMGTWCEDCQREVPRFIKVLNHLNFNFENLTIIGVDKNKKAEGTEVDLLDSEFVPTIIFYVNEKEIGRIVESPAESIENELTKIL